MFRIAQKNLTNRTGSNFAANVISSDPFQGVANSVYSALQRMGYNDTQSPYVPNSQVSSGFLSTFGPIDIVALQYMYGKNPNFNIGNTTYTFPNSTTKKFWETICRE